MKSKTHLLVTILTCLFPIICLSFGKGYNYAAAPLFLCAILLLKETIITLSTPQVRLISLVFSSYFLVFVLAMLIHGESASYIDQTSRIIMALPVLLLLICYPPKLKWLIISFMIGSIIAGVIALYQTQIQLMPRAFERWGPEGVTWWHKGYMPIQSGNMAMTFGIISLCFTLYFYKTKQTAWLLLGVLGTLLGMLASFLSGSRGGWILLPVAVIYLVLANTKFSLKTLVSAGVLLILLIGSAASNDAVREHLRLNEAINNISQYTNGDKNTSIGIRFELWKSAAITIKQYPILGLSKAQRIEERKQQIEAGTLQLNPEAIVFHAHNEYLEALSLRGLFGLIVLIAMLVAPILIFMKNKGTSNPELTAVNQAGIAASIMFIGYGLTQVFLGHNSGMVFYSFITATLLGLSIQLKQNNSQLTGQP
ncbi:O-antigen ligase family protein [Motilimonas cestriensis]|uniref:O-antigen ligase family protein n=1 Tax=Motilimonas cestriensis TaxID=2742685 RepID=A0ABS8W6W8_9GAMM|nr:O-antigen ligase family protein [Motilimonas cestriensis]MCE2594015.1 O-antigen ligase family protein [Motilimonas cestriensis]